MNGIALLLISATLGVEYDWRTTDDGQIEYVLIVEPDFLTSLAEGSEIRSSVPPELESVQRLCIRIAQPTTAGVAPRPETPRKLAADAFRSSRIGLRAATDPTTILWKANAQHAENTLVRYGWQPTKDGLQEYFVQVDPKLLRTLGPGDEIYTTLSAEAGRTDTFVVFSNVKPLPKVPGRSAALATGSSQPSALPGNSPPLAPANTFAPNSFGPPPFSSPPAASTSPATFGPPTGTAANNRPSGFAPPRTFGATDDPVYDPNASRVNPVTGYEPAQPPAYGANGFQSGNTRPNLNAPLPAATDTFRNDTYQTNGLRDNQFQNQPGGIQPPSDPYRRDVAPPPTDPRNDLFPGGSYANSSNGAAMRPNNQPLPPAGNAPYRPSVGYPQDNSVVNRGYNDPALPANQQQAVDYRPTAGDNQLASLPNNNTLRPGLRDDLKAGSLGTTGVPAEKPWWTLVFTAFGLFISIGANLYLGWTAAEFYSRYRLAVERLRTTGGRG